MRLLDVYCRFERLGKTRSKTRLDLDLIRLAHPENPGKNISLQHYKARR